MDHSVKAMPPASSRHPMRALVRFLNRHRFENDELEGLYQRYVYKLQHSSVTAVVALFAALAIVLAALGFTYAQGATLQVRKIENYYYFNLPFAKLLESA